MAWVVVAATVVSAGVGLYAANKQSQAADDAANDQKRAAKKAEDELRLQNDTSEARDEAINSRKRALAIQKGLRNDRSQKNGTLLTGDSQATSNNLLGASSTAGAKTILGG